MKTMIAKVSIQCDCDPHVRIKPDSEIEYKYVDEEDKGWQDPWGGEFTEAEQVAFNRIACGTAKSVTLSVGTKFERVVTARGVVIFA